MSTQNTNSITAFTGLLLVSTLLVACGGGSNTTTSNTNNSTTNTNSTQTDATLSGRAFIEQNSGNLLFFNAGGTAFGYTGTGEDASTETLTWNLEGNHLSILSAQETARLTVSADTQVLQAADNTANLVQALPLSLSAMNGKHFKLDKPSDTTCLAGGTLSVTGTSYILREQCNTPTPLGTALVTQSSTLENVETHANVVRRFSPISAQSHVFMLLKSGNLDNSGIFVHATFGANGFTGIHETGFSRVAEPLQ